MPGAAKTPLNDKNISDPTILVVEDDPSYGQYLLHLLSKMGHPAVLAPSLTEARSVLGTRAVRLVLLDRRLEGNRNGFQLCLELKQDPRTRAIPVIALTGAVDFEEEMQSYRYGADIYLNKDQVTREKLQAYVRTFLSRLPYKEEAAGQLTVGRVKLDRARRTLQVDDKVFKDLPPRQFELLYLVACGRGELVSRESLVNALWSGPVRDRQVDVLISRLRHRLGPEADFLIEPVRGLGYRLHPSDKTPVKALS